MKLAPKIKCRLKASTLISCQIFFKKYECRATWLVAENAVVSTFKWYMTNILQVFQFCLQISGDYFNVFLLSIP